MGKTEKFLEEFGERIDESLGGGKVQPLLIQRPRDRDPQHSAKKRAKDAAEIRMDRIISKEQCRTVFDDKKIQMLADSIKEVGLIQPVTVRWDKEEERYVIISGERRFRAASLLGLTHLRCDIKGEKEELSREELAELQLAENCAREDLNPIERARAFQAMKEDFGYSGRQLAKKIGVDQTTVTRHITLLKLDEAIQEQVLQGEVSMAIARQASRFDDKKQQHEFIKKALHEGLTGESAAEIARETLAETNAQYKPRNRIRTATDRQYTVSSGTRFRVTNRSPIDAEQLQKDVLELVEKIEGEL